MKITQAKSSQQSIDDLFRDNVVNVNKEISNNLGEELEIANLSTKFGSKLSKLTEEIEDGKRILKSIADLDDKDIVYNQVKLLIGTICTGSHKRKQLEYLEKKSTPIEMLAQAYNLVINKQEALDKVKTVLKQNLEWLFVTRWYRS